MSEKIYYCPNCGSNQVQAGIEMPQKGIRVAIAFARCLDCGYGRRTIIQ